MMLRFRIALRDIITSFNDFLNDLNDKYIGRIANNGKVCILIINDINVKYKMTRVKPSIKSPYNI